MPTLYDLLSFQAAEGMQMLHISQNLKFLLNISAKIDDFIDRFWSFDFIDGFESFLICPYRRI